MSTLLGILFFAGGPVLGAVLAIALGGTRAWQVIVGAVLGQGGALVAARVWSEYVAARAMRRALQSTHRGPNDSPGGATLPGRPSNVVIRATGLTWRDHLVTLSASAGFAVLVGSLVATTCRIVSGRH